MHTSRIHALFYNEHMHYYNLNPPPLLKHIHIFSLFILTNFNFLGENTPQLTYYVFIIHTIFTITHYGTYS